ncbi:hypothetical protein JKP88DRAFT_241851 [Tribonema minus]|uniref:Uncharacterized protein n=1 Tax=Tribonema minus TaxID=303371 RepID=A0A836CBS3_9STRA|nr:hypothetical protein JKP88DRAFT_241851 [Tribonema minus]
MLLPERCARGIPAVVAVVIACLVLLAQGHSLGLEDVPLRVRQRAAAPPRGAPGPVGAIVCKLPKEPYIANSTKTANNLARHLAECDGTHIDVKWHGTVRLDDTLVIGAGQSLRIWSKSASIPAVIDGQHKIILPRVGTGGFGDVHADNAYGGAIYSEGTLVCRSLRFAGNRASGGAIYNQNGTMMVTNSSFAGNKATERQPDHHTNIHTRMPRTLVTPVPAPVFVPDLTGNWLPLINRKRHCRCEATRQTPIDAVAPELSIKVYVQQRLPGINRPPHAARRITTKEDSAEQRQFPSTSGIHASAITCVTTTNQTTALEIWPAFCSAWSVNTLPLRFCVFLSCFCMWWITSGTGNSNASQKCGTMTAHSHGKGPSPEAELLLKTESAIVMEVLPYLPMVPPVQCAPQPSAEHAEGESSEVISKHVSQQNNAFASPRTCRKRGHSGSYDVRPIGIHHHSRRHQFSWPPEVVTCATGRYQEAKDAENERRKSQQRCMSTRAQQQQQQHQHGDGNGNKASPQLPCTLPS